MLKQLI